MAHLSAPLQRPKRKQTARTRTWCTADGGAIVFQQRTLMTTASEVDDKNPTPYVFVSGDAEQEHQDEINRFASKGYRVISMSQNSASVSYGKSVVVLMGHGIYAQR